MKAPKTQEELARMAQMGIWFKDVRETQNMSIPEFAKFIGIKDREVRMIEAGQHEIEPFVLKLIKRRTGREFGENLVPETVFVPDEAVMEITVSRPADETLPIEKIDKPLVRVKPEALAARKKVLKARKHKRFLRNDEERNRVSIWLKEKMKEHNLSQRGLAEKSGVKEHTIRDLYYCNTRLTEEVEGKICSAFTKSVTEAALPHTFLDNVNKAILEKNPPTSADVIDKIIKSSGVVLEPSDINEINKVIDPPQTIEIDLEAEELNANREVSQADKLWGSVDDFKKAIEDHLSRQIDCIRISQTWQISKTVGKRQYWVYLTVFYGSKTFKIENMRHFNEFKFSASKDFELCTAVAECILAAIRKAEEEISLIP
jgi:transcriptional regulator with XRE-family HTH domain